MRIRLSTNPVNAFPSHEKTAFEAVLPYAPKARGLPASFREVFSGGIHVSPGYPLLYILSNARGIYSRITKRARIYGLFSLSCCISPWHLTVYRVGGILGRREYHPKRPLETKRVSPAPSARKEEPPRRRFFRGKEMHSRGSLTIEYAKVINSLV